MILHTLNEFPFEWQRADMKPVSDKLIRDSIGESIPPKGLSIIFRHLNKILYEDDRIFDLYEDVQ